jgi:hypothetical protein
MENVPASVFSVYRIFSWATNNPEYSTKRFAFAPGVGVAGYAGLVRALVT